MVNTSLNSHIYQFQIVNLTFLIMFTSLKNQLWILIKKKSNIKLITLVLEVLLWTCGIFNHTHNVVCMCTIVMNMIILFIIN